MLLPVWSWAREFSRTRKGKIILPLTNFSGPFLCLTGPENLLLVHLLVATVSSIIQHWNLFSLGGQWGWVKEGWLFKANCAGFPDSSVGKESTCNAGDPGWIPGSGTSTGEGIVFLGFKSKLKPTPVFLGFPCGLAGKEFCLQWGRPGFNPWVGKIPWRRERLPVQYSGLENSMNCIIHGVSKNQTRLSDFKKQKREGLYIRWKVGFRGGSDSKQSACKSGDLGPIPGSGRSSGGHGNPLQYSCLGNPMDRGAWWATVHGVDTTEWLTHLIYSDARSNSLAD